MLFACLSTVHLADACHHIKEPWFETGLYRLNGLSAGRMLKTQPAQLGIVWYFAKVIFVYSMGSRPCQASVLTLSGRIVHTLWKKLRFPIEDITRIRHGQRVIIAVDASDCKCTLSENALI